MLNLLQSDFINMEIHMLNNLQVTLIFIIEKLQSKFEINSQNPNQWMQYKTKYGQNDWQKDKNYGPLSCYR